LQNEYQRKAPHVSINISGGVIPNETGNSVEIVKVMDENALIGIKLDIGGNYYYVATIYAIRIQNCKEGCTVVD